MIKVTDPNVLSQLNGNKVMDPQLLAQLNAPQEMGQPQIQSMAQPEQQPPVQKQNLNPILGGAAPVKNGHWDVNAFLNMEKNKFRNPEEEKKAFDTALNFFGGGGAVGVSGKLLESFKPQRMADQILNTLGNVGRKNVAETSEQIGQKIANKLKETGNYYKQEAYKHFDPILKKFGDSQPFDGTNFGNNWTFKLKEFPPKVQEFMRTFNKNKSFTNMNELRKQVGSELGRIQRKTGLNYDPAAEAMEDRLGKIYGFLSDHTKDFLNKEDPKMAAQWEKGVEFYKKHGVPYDLTPGIEKIVEGKVGNPFHVHKLFENPEGELNAFGKRTSAEDTRTILGHLPKDTLGNILFSKIEGYGENEPQNVFNNLKKAYQQGYSELFTPGLKAMHTELGNRLNNLKILKAAGKYAGIPTTLLGAGGYAVNEIVKALRNHNQGENH